MRRFDKAGHLESSKSWETRYNELVAMLIDESEKMLKGAPVRPAMYIGTFETNRDAEYLMMALIQEMHQIIRLKDLDDSEFVKKWGTGAQYYLRNISTRRTHLENLDRIREVAEDFVKWSNGGKLEPHSIQMVKELYLDNYNYCHKNIASVTVQDGKLYVTLVPPALDMDKPTTFKGVPVVYSYVNT